MPFQVKLLEGRLNSYFLIEPFWPPYLKILMMTPVLNLNLGHKSAQSVGHVAYWYVGTLYEMTINGIIK